MQIASGSGPDLSVVPVQRSDAQVIKGGRAEYVIEVAGKTQPVGRSIEITGPARDVKLTVEGGLDFSSMEALAASVATAGMTDEEKVKACFYLAVDNFYDRGSTGCEAPLEYISLWGFSWCGNFALFLDALWTAAGFPCVFMNPVIGHNGGHTIAVVYYDNQWHMYDARLRGYFLNRDNRTVASLVELDRDDDLIRRALDLNNRMVGHWSLYTVNYNYYNSSSDWYDGYNAHFGNKTLFHKDCPPWDPRLDLRQGEKITLRWDNRGKWWNRKDLAPRWLELHPHEGLEAKKIPPLIYANGTLETTVDPRLVKKQAKEFNGIRARKGKFQPAGAGRKATVVYRVRVPYFIPSMRVVAQGYRKTEDDCLAIDISADEGKTWQPVWQAERTGKIEVDVTTDQTQRCNWHSPNKYSCLVRFSLQGSKSASDVSLGDIRILTDLYYRPLILPALKKGMNRITYSDRSRGRHKRQVIFNWQEECSILLSGDKPCVGDEVTVTAQVSNRGDETARAVVVRFYDGDPALGGVQIGQDQVIDRIDPGRAGTAQVLWRAGQRHLDSSWGVSLGLMKKMKGYTHNTLFVQVDPDGRISENNEGNNLASRQVIVYNQANLVLKDPSFVTFDRRDNGKVRISATVRNHNLSGLLPRAREARDVVVRFYDGQPVHGRLKGDNLIGEAVIPSIEPGESGIARVDWDVRNLRGLHRVYVVVDPEDDIPEPWQGRHGQYFQVKKDIFF